MGDLKLVVIACVLMAQSGHAKIDCVSECTGLHGFYQSCDTCDHFIWCNEGKLFEVPCGSGLVWDNTKGVCTETSTTCDVSSCVDECAGRQGFYQSCESCDHFVWCNEGQQFELPCGSGLVWDNNKKTCSETSSTCSNLIKEIPPSEHYIIGCENDCAGLPHGTVYHSCNGCQNYTWCLYGTAYNMTCGGLFFDTNEGLCVEESSSTCRADKGDLQQKCGIKEQPAKRTLPDILDQEKADKVAGGMQSERGEWPWMAALVWKSGTFACAGTLIADRWVLTAAHCLDQYFSGGVTKPGNNMWLYYLRVQLGEENINELSYSDAIEMDRVILHPLYNRYARKMGNDIALIRLQKRVNDRALCLPGKDERYGNQTCIIAGWGQRVKDGPISPDLWQAQVEVWERDVCKNVQILFEPTLSDQFVCINSSPEGDTCPGDSGGPLMCQNQDGRWTQIGVISYTFGNCAENRHPSRFMDVRRLLDWIETSIADNGGY